MSEEKKLTDEYITSQLPEPELGWTLKARELIKGDVIIGGRYLTKEEATNMGWSKRPFCVFLKSGTVLYPACDDEGNDGGALFTNSEELPCIPVLT